MREKYYLRNSNSVFHDCETYPSFEMFFFLFVKYFVNLNTDKQVILFQPGLARFKHSDNRFTIVPGMRITVDIGVKLLQFSRLFTKTVRVDVHKCKGVRIL